MQDNESYEELILAAASREPDWRFKTASVLRRSASAPSRRSDAAVRRMFAFLRKWHNDNRPPDLPELQREFPATLGAFALYRLPTRDRWLLEAGLLADAPCGELADFTGLQREVVTEYGLQHFDVAGRRNSAGWVVNRWGGLTGGPAAGDPDAWWKMLAFRLGWDGFRRWVEGGENREVVSDLFRTCVSKKGVEAAWTVQVNGFTAPKLIEQTRLLLADDYKRETETRALAGRSGGSEEARKADEKFSRLLALGDMRGTYSPDAKFEVVDGEFRAVPPALPAADGSKEADHA